MTESSQHYFNAPNLDGEETHRLSYLDWGDSQNSKIIVCVHGLTRNAHDFDYLSRKLAADYRIIAIDIAGRGDSDSLTNPAEYNYATYMIDCLALLDDLNLDSVNWLGTSMGGIIGMMIAAMHPHRINRLILNDIGAFIPKASLQRIVEYVKRTPDKMTSRKQAEEQLRENAATFGITDENHWQHMFTYSIKEQDDGSFRFAFDPQLLTGMRAETNDFQDIDDVDLSELWEAVEIPALILRGAQSDVLEKETLTSMLKSHPDCQSVEFEGIGHAPTLMEDNQIKAIVDWLSKD